MGRKLNSRLTSGVKGQMSIENYDLLNVLSSQGAVSGIFYIGNDGVYDSEYQIMYKLLILKNEPTTKKIQAVSHAFTIDLNESRKILIDGTYIYEGIASDINIKRKILDDANVLYKIEPTYKKIQ